MVTLGNACEIIGTWVSFGSSGFFNNILCEPWIGEKTMFNESVKVLSLIDSGEQKSWDIAQKMDVPIKRFRAQIETLLNLKFIRYEVHCFKYFLTTRGVNVLKCTNSEGNNSGETPYILIGS